MNIINNESDSLLMRRLLIKLLQWSRLLFILSSSFDKFLYDLIIISILTVLSLLLIIILLLAL